MGFLFVALFCHWAPHFSSQLKYHFLMTWFLCEPGVAMVPINWQEMQCPVTLQKEFRKVAKVCWLFPIHRNFSDTSWLFKLNHRALRKIAGASWSMILIFWPLQVHCWFLEEAASDTWSFSDVRVMKVGHQVIDIQKLVLPLPMGCEHIWKPNTKCWCICFTSLLKQVRYENSFATFLRTLFKAHSTCCKENTRRTKWKGK
jgi:hypothetical protein